jgi:hypothetical protein
MPHAMIESFLAITSFQKVTSGARRSSVERVSEFLTDARTASWMSEDGGSGVVMTLNTPCDVTALK